RAAQRLRGGLRAAPGGLVAARPPKRSERRAFSRGARLAPAPGAARPVAEASGSAAAQAALLSIVRGFWASVLGTSTVSTPSRKLARMPSGSTCAGRRRERLKLP